MKVIVAMSGGVDSSVAAALLKEAGCEVIGVTMQIWPRDRQDRSGGCCGLGAVKDAQMVARQLGIPHYVVNFRNIFARKVIADFCEEYSHGRTPNPCIRCNQYIKFDALVKKARQLDADFIATGHHARIERDKATGRYILKKGVDRRKDQSYFLYTFTQEQLSHTLLPVGNFSKSQVREIAGKLGLSVFAKPESQEICFIPDNNYPEFLKDYLPRAIEPGQITDKDGNILGSHKGIPYYTIGQRKGLGIAAGEPLYVIGIEPEQNAIIVGSKKETCEREFIASGLNWISIAVLDKPITVKAKIRYQHQEAEAEVIPLEKDKVYVKFTAAQTAITSGQAVVFYQGDIVIGGGTIDEVKKSWRKTPSKEVAACLK